MVLALPVGALVGWLASKALAAAVLRAGTPVPLVGLGWAAAAVAVAGGVLAAAGAARRTLARSVLAQWNQASAQPGRRGWVLDAVVAVLAIAALVELFVSGVLGNASHNPLALLAPGLIALTVALVSSRAPAILPAIVTGSILDGSDGKPVQTYGLDGNISLTVRPVGVAAALPGAGSDGLIVNRDYAELASNGVANQVNDQVWLSPNAPQDFAAKLRAAGVAVTSSQTAVDTAGQYRREGPALALVLFLTDAVAAAILAAGGAVLGLHLAGRRRGYEMAALVATGASKRSLGGGLFVEQGLTLGFGALFGIGSGLLAAVLAVPSIPEFVNLPLNGGAPLHYTPSSADLGSLLGVALVLLAVAAVASVLALIRSVRPDQLREAAP